MFRQADLCGPFFIVRVLYARQSGVEHESGSILCRKTLYGFAAVCNFVIVHKHISEFLTYMLIL